MKNLYLSQNNMFIRDIMGIGSARMTRTKFFPSRLAVPNNENVPGWCTNKSWDVFNFHFHGGHVAPHLFDPVGTSDPNADWISIQPNNKYGQQCFCYKLHLDEDSPMGLFFWHTHRHGTTSMMTWGGGFGIILTDVESELEGKKLDPKLRARSFFMNTVHLAKQKDLKFGEKNIIPFAMWNTKWRFQGLFPNSEVMASNPFAYQVKKANKFNGGRVELNNFLPNQMPSTAMNPYLVNDEFQPTYTAWAGQLTLFRLLCGSAEWMCGFQLYYEDTLEVVPFYFAAADDMT